MNEKNQDSIRHLAVKIKESLFSYFALDAKGNFCSNTQSSGDFFILA